MEPNYKPPTGVQYPKDLSRFVISMDRTNKENVSCQLELLKSELQIRIAGLGPNRSIEIRVVNHLNDVNCFGDFVYIAGEEK